MSSTSRVRFLRLSIRVIVVGDRVMDMHHYLIRQARFMGVMWILATPLRPRSMTLVLVAAVVYSITTRISISSRQPRDRTRVVPCRRACRSTIYRRACHMVYLLPILHTSSTRVPLKAYSPIVLARALMSRGRRSIREGGGRMWVWAWVWVWERVVCLRMDLGTGRTLVEGWRTWIRMVWWAGCRVSFGASRIV